MGEVVVEYAEQQKQMETIMADIVALRESKAKVNHVTGDLTNKIECVLAELKKVNASVEEEKAVIASQLAKRD